MSKLTLLLAILATLVAAPACAQIPGLSLTPAAASASSASTTATAPAVIPIDQIAIRAEDDGSRLRDIGADLDSDDTLTEVERELTPLQRTATIRTQEVRRVLGAHPSVAAIRALEPSWNRIASAATELTKELTHRAAQLSRELATLDKLEASWTATQKAAEASQAPAQVDGQITEVLALISKTRAAALQRQSEVLAAQAKSAAIEAHASDTLEQLTGASQRAASQLMQRDSLPIWDEGFWSSAVAAVTSQGSQSLRGQFVDLWDYFGGHIAAVGIQVTLFIVLVLVLRVARQRVQNFTKDEPDMAQAARVLDGPVSTALLVACFLGYWVYPDRPDLLGKLLGLLGVVPTLLVVRRLIEPHMAPLLYALTGFYLLDRLRTVAAVNAPVARLIFVVEILAGVVFLAWLYMSSRRREVRPWTTTATWRLIHLASALGIVIAVIVIFGNLAGYQGLSTLIGTSMLRGAYLAILFYALTRIAQGLILGLFHLRPLTYLSMIRQHRRLITDRITRIIAWAAIAFWIYVMLAASGFWDVAAHRAAAFLGAAATLGKFSLSLGQVLGFIVAVTVAVWTARLVTFILEEEVYPKVNLARGVPYVISTMLRYAILLIGLVVGLATLGIDMTKFTILAGAFSVGLGFGMQNIVNNFVSGLIVLFERPMKVGDVVQFGDVVGRVERIGIRASIIRSANGAEVIIPNGTLIANNLTNWTFSSKSRRVDVAVQVAPAAESSAVEAILLDVAKKFPDVAETPPAQALLTTFTPDAMQFELRVWADAASDWAKLKSDLTAAISDALRKAGIALK